MATNNYFITAGLPPDDLVNDPATGINQFFITAGLPPDDIAAAEAAAALVTSRLWMFHQNRQKHFI